MRNGQKRMRGRGGNNHRKSQNPLTRVYESNGPDVKIRGTASHIAEKYIQLARDAQSSGDPVAAENYYQHAEHYFRLIAAAQEQFRQQNPYYNNQQPQQQGQGGHHKARPTTTSTTATMTASLSWARTSRATRRSRRCSRPSLICRAMPSRSRRATSRCKTARSTSSSPISSRVRAARGRGQDWAACRHSSPAAVAAAAAAKPRPTTATSRATAARIVSDIAGAGAIVAVAIAPTGRNFGGNNPQGAAPQSDEGGDEPRQPD